MRRLTFSIALAVTACGATSSSDQPDLSAPDLTTPNYRPDLFAADLSAPDLSFVLPAGCVDGRKNGKETDVDCGGGTCAGCANGKMCECR